MKRICYILIMLCLVNFFISCTSKDIKKELDEYMEITQSDYNLEYVNLKDENNILVSIDYKSLIKKIDKKETFILYVGGSWCPNCQAAIPYINNVAKEKEIQKVFNFDTRINENKDSLSDIRNCNNKAQEILYRDFINKIGYINPNGIYSKDTDIYRMAVPTVIVVKNGVLIDSLTREYIYSETLNDIVGEDKDTPMSQSYINELKILFDKL